MNLESGCFDAAFHAIKTCIEPDDAFGRSEIAWRSLEVNILVGGEVRVPIRNGDRFTDVEPDEVRAAVQLDAEASEAKLDEHAKLICSALLPGLRGGAEISKNGLDTGRNLADTLGQCIRIEERAHELADQFHVTIAAFARAARLPTVPFPPGMMGAFGRQNI